MIRLIDEISSVRTLPHRVYLRARDDIDRQADRSREANGARSLRERIHFEAGAARHCFCSLSAGGLAESIVWARWRAIIPFGATNRSPESELVPLPDEFESPPMAGKERGLRT